MTGMELPFLVGDVEKFEECLIDTTYNRKSLDGKITIVHIHGLTIEQFNEVRTKTSLVAHSQESAAELMLTPEWTSEVV